MKTTPEGCKTQQEIAKKMGMSVATVNRILREFQERVAYNVIVAGFEVGDFERGNYGL